MDFDKSKLSTNTGIILKVMEGRSGHFHAHVHLPSTLPAPSAMRRCCKEEPLSRDPRPAPAAASARGRGLACAWGPWARMWKRGPSRLQGTRETLDLNLLPSHPPCLSKETRVGHFLPKGVCGGFGLSAALCEENPGPL